MTKKEIFYDCICSKCGEGFLRKPNESVTCPKCRDSIPNRKGVKNE